VNAELPPMQIHIKLPQPLLRRQQKCLPRMTYTS
jgi:hypothetical protein